MQEKFLRTVVISLVLSMLGMPKQAFADYEMAATQCYASNNSALIRFGINASMYSLAQAYFFSIPTRIERQFSKIPYQDSVRCKLANGDVISAVITESKFRYTENGGDLNKYLSLKLNQTYVFKNKQIYVGYGQGVVKFAAVLFKDGRFRLIRYDKDLPPYDHTP